MSIGATSSTSSTVTAATGSSALAKPATNVIAVARRALVFKRGTNLVDEEGRHLLHRAASGIKRFLSSIVGKKYLIDLKDEEGRTRLMLAAFQGNQEVCDILIKAGASLEAVDPHGWGVLHWAVCGGNAETIRLFLQYKESLLESKTKHDFTPGMLAYRGSKAWRILLKAELELSIRIRNMKKANKRRSVMVATRLGLTTSSASSSSPPNSVNIPSRAAK